MDRIKVGDRVKVTWEGSEYFGEKGVVEKAGYARKVKLDTSEKAGYICKVKLDNGEYVRLCRWEIEKMDKIKVGDRVKVTSEGSALFGERGVVVEEWAKTYEVMFDTGGCVNLLEWKLEKVGEEMEYEVGKPYLWFGGECPLPKGTKVKVRLGNKNFSDIRENWHWESCYDCSALFWQHNFECSNIVMFEVVEYPKSTRKVEMELTEEEITTIKGVLGKVNL